MTAPAPIDRETALQRTASAFFAALDDFRGKNPAAAARIDETIAAHMRSAAPMTFMLDTGPVVRVDPVVEITRGLADGGKYTLVANDGGSVTETVIDLDGDRAVVTMTAIELIRRRSDMEAVASSAGATP